METSLKHSLVANCSVKILNYRIIDKVYKFLLLTSQQSNLCDLLVTNCDLHGGLYMIKVNCKIIHYEFLQLSHYYFDSRF